MILLRILKTLHFFPTYIFGLLFIRISSSGLLLEQVVNIQTHFWEKYTLQKIIGNDGIHYLSYTMIGHNSGLYF